MHDLAPQADRPVASSAGRGELGELSAVIAHEIRSPLAGIAATAEAVRDALRSIGTGPILPAPAQPPLTRSGTGEEPELSRFFGESVDVILEEVRRIEQVVHHLLEFARTRQPRLAPSDLTTALTRVLHVVARTAAAAGITVRVESASESPAVLLDPELMAQVFRNLATNAIQAMPQGGTLTLRTRRPDAGSSFVCVEFLDTGGGIAPEDLPRIFEPFFTRRENGIGLGLATAASLAEAQGGYITAESTRGVGSCFTVYVRRADAEAAPAGRS
jgi:signal transduction histidine kinase